MTTQSQLQTSVDNWLARDDVAATGTDWPQILLNAEAEISRDIRTVVQEQRLTITTASSRFENLPTDYLEMRQIFIDDTNGRRFLEYQTPEVIREQSTWQSGRRTSFYSIEGDDSVNGIGDIRLVLAPAPDPSNPQDIEVLYWARFPALVNPTDTNWLLQNHYDVYLYQALKQAAIYLQESELAQVYDGYYQTAREALRVNENRKRYRGNTKVAYGNPRPII